MLDHYIQKNIVYALALAESMRFSDLKPDGLENKLFDYHLKKVIAAGFVIKADSGEYALTSKGRRVGKEVIKKNDQFLDRALSVLFLVVKRSDGAWLLCRRKTHPLLDRVGFMHAHSDFIEHADVTAQKELLRKVGLDGEFTVRGSGYLRMYESDNLESFTHFTMLECLDPKGELQQLDELAEYYWQTDPDFSSSDLLPSIPLFVDKLAQPGLFYLEEDFSS